MTSPGNAPARPAPALRPAARAGARRPAAPLAADRVAPNVAALAALAAPSVAPLAALAAPSVAPLLRVYVPLQIGDSRAPAFGNRVQHLHGRAMGTVWQVWLVAPRQASTRLATAAQAIQTTLDRLQAQMSPFLPDSDLSRFNTAPAGNAQRLPADFATVVDAALALARDSGGAFDPTLGAAISAWGFGPGERFDAPGFQPPDAEALPPAGVPPAAGWQRLRWDAAHATLHQPGGVQLNLSAIAKGHAVDVLATQLQAAGWCDGLVEVGGELRGWGLKPDGQPWWVDLASPDQGPVRGRVALHGLAVATSGDDWRWVADAQGRRRPHTLDPAAQAPLRHRLAMVSVLHPSALWADGWATALLVPGLQAGLALAERHGLAARFVQREGPGRITLHETRAMARLAEV